MKRPRVSVVLVTYNHEQYIERAIESILAQTYDVNEIICIDDNSQDSNRAILQRYAKQDSRIHLILHEQNMGPSIALNDGIRKATGEYIVVQSGDDMSLPHRIEREIAYLEEYKDIPSVCSWVKIIDDDDCSTQQLKELETTFNIPYCSRNEMLYRFFLDNNFLNASSQAFRASIFQRVGFFNPSLFQYQDYDMNIRIALEAPIAILDEVLLQYRIRNDGKNISVGKGLQTIRSTLEMDVLLDNYITLSCEDFTAIFGDKYTAITYPETIPYLLGKILLEEKTSLGRRLWALKTIYQTIDKENVLDILYKNIGYEYKDFIQLAELL